VSIVDGDRRSLALGPFNTHGEALGYVDRVRRFVEQTTRDAHWWAFGTCHHRTGQPVGVLNGKLGVTL
jgi:hypothetical protein